MLTGTDALAIRRELIPSRWRGITAPRTFISPIRPEASCLCFTIPGGQQLDGRIIRKDGLAGEHIALDGLGKWLQQCSYLADPPG